jgi:hypothetical protein
LYKYANIPLAPKLDISQVFEMDDILIFWMEIWDREPQSPCNRVFDPEKCSLRLENDHKKTDIKAEKAWIDKRKF